MYRVDALSAIGTHVECIEDVKDKNYYWSNRSHTQSGIAV